MTLHNTSKPLVCFNCIYHSKMKASIAAAMYELTPAAAAANILEEKNPFQLRQ
ncbi:hypothetical protein CAter10_1552 [Collimonas arenae]|nr:hypothetical protein CAter10_1552 [Collimonas arenae]